MDKNTAKQRIIKLRNILWENSKKYYVDNAPTMSDFEYDSLMHELEALETQFPDLITPNSPTQKVGSDLINSTENLLFSNNDISNNLSVGKQEDTKNQFTQYPHKYPMLSLGNTYNIQEIEDFASRATKTLNKSFTFCCELKFDGTAICLTYINGKLIRALTRGDGTMGDDVTENVKHIKNIPQTLNGSGYPNEFEIRGEIVMPYSSFDKLNKDRIDNDELPFANPRNAASGSLKLLDPKQVSKRGLYCTLYHIISNNMPATTHYDCLMAAKSWGLPISTESKICNNIKDIEDYINYWDIERKKLPFATDGIVIKINELPYQTELGYTAKFPRWAVAYKFKAEQALTQILSIDYQVGRTGAVTPVANLAPVLLSGTTVKRATLNNADLMSLLDIRIGDFVYVEKGGEIIPKITRVELSKRGANVTIPQFPMLCPDCGTPLIKAENEAKYFCPNTEECPTQIKGKLLHFVGRKAMNILAGEATIEQLYNKGYLLNIADYYTLTKEMLLELNGWKDKSATNLLNSINKSKQTKFEQVLFAIGIRNVGEVTAKYLARHFKNIEALSTATKEELTQIQDVGQIIADSIFDFFRNNKNIDIINRLKNEGVQLSINQSNTTYSNKLNGANIVVSGTFSKPREEIKNLIEINGGKVLSSISSKTSFILAGEKMGPEKLKKAEQLGIPLKSEEEFFKILGANNNDTKEEYNLFSI